MAADVSTKADLPSAWLIRFSPYLKSGTRVLEIASGNGRNTRFLAGLGCDVTAVDINPVPEPLAGVRYIQRDLEKRIGFSPPIHLTQSSASTTSGVIDLARYAPVSNPAVFSCTRHSRDIRQCSISGRRILSIFCKTESCCV